MNRKLKISLIVFGLLTVGVAALMTTGFYSMEIEDTYGDNEDIFYCSNHGDLVVNHTTKEFGEVRKTSTRFYLVRQTDTLNIYEWWDDKDIEIYRPVRNNNLPDNLNYNDIGRLSARNELELIRKLR